MNNLAMELTRAAAVVAALGGSSAEFAALSDAEVLAARGPIADLLRLSSTAAAMLAGTIAYRSRPQLGQSGLAARQGFGNPTLMVQNATGLSRIEAGRLVAVGVLMSETERAERAAAEAAAEAERKAACEADQWAAREAERAAAWAALHPNLPLTDAEPRPITPIVAVPLVPLLPLLPVLPVLPAVAVPWQAPIMHEIAAGTLSPGVGDALLRGLGTLDQAITAQKLAAALRLLLVEAPSMNTEQAFKRARRVRDELDVAGILAREKQARDDTTWSLWRRADGMVTLHALLPPEQGEMWIATYDALTSPRRGGVRFVDPQRAAWAQSVKDDPRTVDQIAADSFTQLLKLGADADPNTLFGGRRPVVQVIVTEHDRPSTIPAPTTIPSPSAVATTGPAGPAKATATTGPAAFGYLEGNPAPVSAETVARQLCDTGYLGILFSQTGQPLNVGRDARLFNREQRRALAVRDGGCRWPGCDRPPSWTEAHHIDSWLADHGLSNIDQAILLCAHHHMLLHNRHWKILLRGGGYWLIPPIDIDPEQTPIALPSKIPLMIPPHQPNQAASTVTAAVAGVADTPESDHGGLDELDQRSGGFPRPGRPRDDYRT
jgi:hypothetical protein